MKESCYSRDGITIYAWDSLLVLRGLPAESVDCCVTSPQLCHSDAIEAMGLLVCLFHRGGQLHCPRGGAYMASSSGDADSPACLLQTAKRQAVLGLEVLDAQIWENRAEYGDGLPVGDLPSVERFPIPCSWLGDEAVSSENRVGEIHRLRLDLFDADPLGIGRLPAIADLSHGVGVLFDADGAVRVEEPGDVSQVVSVHVAQDTTRGSK